MRKKAAIVMLQEILIPRGSKFKIVRDFWSAVEYGDIPEFLGRLKARGHALMAKWGQDILLGKNGKQKRFQFIVKLDAVAVAMVVRIVLEMAAANECNR